MNPLGLLIMTLASISSVGYAQMRLAYLPGKQTIDKFTEIETKYIGDSPLQPDETLRRLEQLLLDADSGTTLDVLSTNLVKELIEYGRTQEESCDEIDMYELAICSRSLDEKAANIKAYLKFHAANRIAHCATIAFSRAKGGLPLNILAELQQLMRDVYREMPPEEKNLPSTAQVAIGVVEYMRQKKALPSRGEPRERFHEQFIASVEPICKSFNQAVGPAANVFGRYTKSDLSDQMNKDDIALVNYYEACLRVLDYWPDAYKVFEDPLSTSSSPASFKKMLSKYLKSDCLRGEKECSC